MSPAICPRAAAFPPASATPACAPAPWPVGNPKNPPTPFRRPPEKKHQSVQRLPLTAGAQPLVQSHSVQKTLDLLLPLILQIVIPNMLREAFNPNQVTLLRPIRIMPPAHHRQKRILPGRNWRRRRAVNANTLNPPSRNFGSWMFPPHRRTHSSIHPFGLHKPSSGCWLLVVRCWMFPTSLQMRPLIRTPGLRSRSIRRAKKPSNRLLPLLHQPSIRMLLLLGPGDKLARRLNVDPDPAAPAKAQGTIAV